MDSDAATGPTLYRRLRASTGLSRGLGALVVGGAILFGANWSAAGSQRVIPSPEGEFTVGVGADAGTRDSTRPPSALRLAADTAPERPACPLAKLFGADATVALSFTGHRFVIPRSYIFSFERAPDDALVRARWPSFGPLCGTKPAEGVGMEEWQGALLILLEDRYAGRSVEDWLERERRVLGPRLPGGQAFGLEREVPGPGSDPYVPRDLYIGRDNGALSALIDCSFEGVTGACEQIFVTAAGTIRVSYSAKLLPHWHDIQCGIVALLQQWKR